MHKLKSGAGIAVNAFARMLTTTGSFVMAGLIWYLYNQVQAM